VISHLLNRELTVYRRTESPDGAGGLVSVFEPVGTVECRVSQAVTATVRIRERVTADQTGAEPNLIVYMEPDADVFRGDELRGDGECGQTGSEEIYRVVGIRYPSEQQWYKRADTVVVQPEPQSAGGGG
jgi:hypothetical protein